MSEDNSDPLEELVVSAEENREQFNRARKRLQQVREELRGYIDTLEEEGTVDKGEANRIRRLVEDGSYGEAREAIQEAREAETLEFEDEDLDQFARAFRDSYEELEASVESVRNALLALSGDVDREDMIDFLYGKHSSLNKRDIRGVFEAFDDVECSGLDHKQMARILSTYNRDLNIEPTVEVLDAIEAETE
jgi:hypothetical protein